MNDPTAKEIIVTGLIAAAVVLAAAVLFYGPGIAAGTELFFTHDIGGSDFWHMNYPIKRFYADGLREGRLPLWCPEIGTGFPLHAAAEVGSLYPTNLVLFSVLPLALALNWSILINLLLAGAFAAMYARQVGARRVASLFAGSTFAMSGFVVTHLKHTSMVASAVWAPLLFLLLERHARSRSRRSLALIALVVATMSFGAHSQIVYYNLLFAGIYAIYLIANAWRQKNKNSGGRANAIRLGGRLLYAVVLGVLLAAPQILPTRELNSHGPRQGGLTLEDATRWEYQWKHLFAFIEPGAFGDPGELTAEPLIDPQTGEVARNPRTNDPVEVLEGFESEPNRPMLYWEITGYVGLLTLALAAACLILGFKRRRVRPLLTFLVVSVLLVLGKNGGLFYVLYHALPGYDLFRFHDRFLLFADLWLAVLAALGLSFLLDRFLPGRRVVAAALAVGAVVLGFVDLRHALADHNPKVEASKWMTPPGTAQAILEGEKGRNEPFRIFSTDPTRFVFYNAYYRARGWKGDLAPYDPAKSMLEPNLGALFGLDHLDVWAPIYPRWIKDVAQAGYLAPDSRTGRAGGVNERIVSLYNVRYLIDPLGVLPPGYPLLGTFPGDVRLRGRILLEQPPYEIELRENPFVFPRAFLVPRAKAVRPDPATSLGTLLSNDFDPRRLLLIADEPDRPVPRWGGDALPMQAPVKVEEYTPHRVKLETTAPQACWLFFSDAWYPGWRAKVDGADTEIYRANVAGRAIPLAPGRHQIEFRYAPTSFRNGLFAALVGLLLLATLGVQGRKLSWLR